MKKDDDREIFFIALDKAENQKLENNKLSERKIAVIRSMQSLFIMKAAFKAFFSNSLSLFCKCGGKTKKCARKTSEYCTARETFFFSYYSFRCFWGN